MVCFEPAERLVKPHPEGPAQARNRFRVNTQPAGMRAPSAPGGTAAAAAAAAGLKADH